MSLTLLTSKDHSSTASLVVKPCQVFENFKDQRFLVREYSHDTRTPLHGALIQARPRAFLESHNACVKFDESRRLLGSPQSTQANVETDGSRRKALERKGVTRNTHDARGFIHRFQLPYWTPVELDGLHLAWLWLDTQPGLHFLCVWHSLIAMLSMHSWPPRHLARR